MLSTKSFILNEEPTYTTLQNVAISPSTEYFKIYEMNTAMPEGNMSINSINLKDNMSLDIIVQPVDTFRYRYKSEKGSHGGIKGKNDPQNKSKKSFPTVKLENCPPSLREKVVVEVTLYTNDAVGKPHVYELTGKGCEDGKCRGRLDENFTVMFKSLAISTRKKEEVLETLKKRKILEYKSRGIFSYNEASVEAEAQKEMKDINLDSAKLCFEAFYDDDMDSPLCEKVFSTPINNQKSAASGDLKIVRLSHWTGKCSGGEVVILLCEKVKKEDIEIWFSKRNNEGDVLWESKAKLNPADVHHQVAIAFETPEYHQSGVDGEVYIQLYRPSDCTYSDPRCFKYKPDDKCSLCSPNKNSTESLTGYHIESKNVPSRKRKKPNPEEDVETVEEYLDSSVMDSPQSIKEEKFDLTDLDIPSKIWSKEFESLFGDLLDNYTEDGSNMSDEYQSMSVEHQPSVDYSSLFNSLSDVDYLISKESAIHADGITDHIAESMGALSLADRTHKQEMKPARQMQKIKLSKNFIEGMNELFKKRETSTYLLYAPNLIPLEDENGNSMLHLAILEQKENLSLIMKMLDLVSEDIINHQNKSKETALHLAVKLDCPKILLLLLVKGGNPNLVDKDGNNCLHLAATYGHIDCLKMLILPPEEKRTWKHGIADIDDLNYDGMSALHLAVIKDFKDGFNVLLKCKADVNLPENKCGQSPLHLAIQQPNLLPIILKQPEIDLLAEDFRGYTAVYLACIKTGKSFDSVSAHLNDDTHKIIEFLENFYQNGEYCSSGNEFESGGHSTSSSDFEDAVEEHELNVVTREDTKCKAVANDKLVLLNGQKSNLMKTEDELVKYLEMNANWKKLADLVDLDTECVAMFGNPAQTVLKRIKVDFDLNMIINLLNVAGLEEGAKLLQKNC